MAFFDLVQEWVDEDPQPDERRTASLLDKSKFSHHLSPEQHRALSDIHEKTDADFLKKDRRFRKEMCGVDDPIDTRPIVVFSGPPGTGKTYALKIMAARSGRKAYAVDVAKVKKNMYEAPMTYAFKVMAAQGRHAYCASNCTAVGRLDIPL